MPGTFDDGTVEDFLLDLDHEDEDEDEDEDEIELGLGDRASRRRRRQERRGRRRERRRTSRGRRRDRRRERRGVAPTENGNGAEYIRLSNRSDNDVTAIFRDEEGEVVANAAVPGKSRVKFELPAGAYTLHVVRGPFELELEPGDHMNLRV